MVTFTSFRDGIYYLKLAIKKSVTDNTLQNILIYYKLYLFFVYWIHTDSLYPRGYSLLVGGRECLSHLLGVQIGNLTGIFCGFLGQE